MTSQPVALTIAGSDPTGGAGLQMDLQVFRLLGLHGCAIPSALTVQDTAKVHQVLPSFPSVVLDQIRILTADLRPQAVKLGMLATDDVLRSVELAVSGFDASIPIVIDPILRASDGTQLLEQRAWSGILRLCERAALVTPNRPEAEALSGLSVGTRTQVEAAARFFVEEVGAGAALIKGGHAEGAPDDCLAQRIGDRTEIQWLEGERLDVGSVHGTGCALSAAITAKLALGEPLQDAVVSARSFVIEGIRGSFSPGGGARLLGWS